MSHLRWESQPDLTAPVLLVAFEGWNDAGDAASASLDWLTGEWRDAPVATIDPEDFYDFTALRPTVAFNADGYRHVTWPRNSVSHGRIPGINRDVLYLRGTEPHLKWRTYCEQVLDVVDQFGVSLVVSLGALLVEVPHTRDVTVVGTAYESSVIHELGLTQSRYEGPTGIVGVLHDACRQANVRSASLWSTVPAYASLTPSPKAALALVQAVAKLVGVQDDVAPPALVKAAAEYSTRLDRVVEDDEEMIVYVQELETRVDENVLLGAAPQDFVSQVEQFLRDQPEL